jgi:hypothetical protein
LRDLGSDFLLAVVAPVRPKPLWKAFELSGLLLLAGFLISFVLMVVMVLLAHRGKR